MFRFFMCAAACAFPLLISSAAGAQSYVPPSDESEIASPVPLGPPLLGPPPLGPPPFGPPRSLTQRYVPHALPARAPGLLIDDAAPAPVAPPAAGIAVTSPEPLARTAAAGLGLGRPVIVVSNVKAVVRE
ncbi:MAG: hypothetical protein IT566_02245 [Rhodospirillaceae bacterium]|nr:hypothetical protein [Rhodospirillaceae bacterium]